MIPGFELIDELGRGAASAVYRARKEGVDYALKVREVPDGGPDDASKGFRREAAFLAAIRHPCLGSVYEVGEVDGRAFMVMELIGGRTLADLLAEGPISEKLALDVISDVASALAATHRVGVVHRDVKPRNIVVGSDGHAKVIDFGLAAPTGVTLEESVAGTVLYCAPEQTGMVRRPVDGRADLYALGVVLFECIAGRPPFEAAEAGELARLHAVSPAPDLGHLRPGISPGLARIVGRLLAKDPDDRYQSAETLLVDLARLQRGELGEDSPLAVADEQPAASSDSPLIGRQAELSILIESLAEARRGQGGAVFVESEAGGGKSRLAAEIMRLARFQHVAVLEARCLSGSPVPFAPLRHAVEGWLRSLERRERRERSRLHEAMRLSVRPFADLLTGFSPALDDLMAGGEDAGGPEPPETTGAAIAQLLLTIARINRGALLVVDGVEHADDATHRVLQRLAGELASSKLLLVVTARNDPPERPGLARATEALADAVRRRIELPRLRDEEVAEMLAAHLGGGRLDETLARELTLRSNGNPAAAIEYLRAALDAGVILPSWGSFVVDRRGLAGLDLPGDLLALELRRLESMSPQDREVLAGAAVVGTRFELELLGAVTGAGAGRARDVVSEAVRARLVGAAGHDRFAFLHEGVRHALLEGLDAATTRQLHQRLAEELSVSEALEASPERVYEIASHYAEGEVDADPGRAFEANARAARLAIANDAIDEGLLRFQTAARIADEHGIAVASDFDEAFATACLQARMLELAKQRLERALSVEADRTVRSRLYEKLGRVHYASADTDRVLECVQLALGELGLRLPTNRLARALGTLWRFVAGVLIGVTRLGFGRAQGARRERYRAEVRLLDLAGQSAFLNLDNRTVLTAALRSLYPVNRIGISPEYVGLYSSIGTLLGVIGLRPLARLVAHHVRKAAARFGDRQLELHVRVNEAISLDFEGRPLEACRRLEEMLRNEGRWLDTVDYQLGAAVLCIDLGLRGYVYESNAWYEDAARRMRIVSDDEHNASAVAYMGIAEAGLLGRPTVGLERVRKVERMMEKLGPSRSMIAAYHHSMVMFHFALGERGKPLEDAIDGFTSSKIRPLTAPLYYRAFWIIKAYARLSQLATASPGERHDRRRSARRALLELRLAGRTPIVHGHFLVALAQYQHLTGHDKRALRALERASRWSLGLDAPALEMEQAAVRSLVLESLGHTTEARRLGEAAYRFADHLGVLAFVRWILPAPPSPAPSASVLLPRAAEIVRPPAAPGGAWTAGSHDETAPGANLTAAAATGRRQHRSQRQLAALLQVSAAAVRTLDPDDLARVALDETVKILGAERALLFLAPEEARHVVVHLGRDAHGNDLQELGGFSSTIVDRVQATRETIIITGTEEGAAFGSESVVAHGLRSILVAPVQLEGRLLGIIYLDNRLAKGVFTRDDLEILVAITNHVAVALETARLARVEMSVQAERNQRELAESLRDSMHKISGTLEPQEVLRNLLSQACLVLKADTGAVLMWRDGFLEVVASITEGEEPPAASRPGSLLELADEPELEQVITEHAVLTSSERPAGVRTPAAEAIGVAGSWVAAPLVAREAAIGALVVATKAPASYGSAQGEIAAAIAGQGVVAYENAQLFSQVQTLAQFDELSGAATRRHFFDLGGRSFAMARRYGHDLATLMLDIDHFKSVNDRYGHAAGDDVIRTVASRISASIRAGDIIGRLGGEEFALVVHETLDGAVGLAERLREAVASSPVTTSSGPVSVTISVGVAGLNDGDSSLSRLLQRTDVALYEAKRLGRNRVSLADERRASA